MNSGPTSSDSGPLRRAFRPPDRPEWLVLATIVAAAGLLAAPFYPEVRDGEGWRQSQGSLRQIGLALLQYHEQYHRLPPAVVADAQGRPLYSWRVVLLPFLEEPGLHSEFHLDEPWDSPHNEPLVRRMPSSYRPGRAWDPAIVEGGTHYQVLVGPGTAFERPGLALRDFPDDPANTLLVVEATEAVPWTKPADLAYHPAQPLPPLGGLFSKPTKFRLGRESGFNAAFADGSTRFISRRTDEQTLRALISRNGGEPVDPSKLE